MANTAKNTKTRFDLKTEATKPLYAGVGVTDLAAEIVRDLVTETQTRLAGVQRTASNPKALREHTVRVVNARLGALTKDAMAYPGKVSSLVDDNVTSLTGQATDAFTDLVERGESLVGRIRRQQSTKATVTSARTTVAKAKTTNTQAKNTSTAATKTAKTAAKKATATVKKTSTKPAAKKAASTKSSAKAAVTTARKTADNAVKAVADAAQKVGD